MTAYVCILELNIIIFVSQLDEENENCVLVSQLRCVI